MRVLCALLASVDMNLETWCNIYKLAAHNLQTAHAAEYQKTNNPIKKWAGASLVGQWLRICLPMQGTRVRVLVWEDRTCPGATKPVSHNY